MENTRDTQQPVFSPAEALAEQERYFAARSEDGAADRNFDDWDASGKPYPGWESWPREANRSANLALKIGVVAMLAALIGLFLLGMFLPS